jgi:uncharacterized protein (DUF2141 family)
MINQMRIFGLFLIAAVLVACANQKPLSGGDKDFTTPKVVSMTPASLNTNFNQKSFQITFDEYVQLNNIYQELIVSPPLKKQPVIKVKNRTVIIEPQEELKPNTTYTFNFGDGIVDLNESNKAEKLVYVFSTGDKLDSMVVYGKTSIPFSNEKLAGMKVMLYDDTVDVRDPKTSLPSYFARTLTDGSFIISYLPSGNYQLVALEDLNGNYKADSDERVSLISEVSSIAIDTNQLQEQVLEMHSQMPEAIDFASYKVDSTGLFSIPWNPLFEGRIPYSFNILDGEKVEADLFKSSEEDTLFYSLKGLPSEKNVRISFTSGENVDTLAIPFFAEDYKKVLRISTGVTSKMLPSEPLIIQSSVRSVLKDPSKIILKKDSVILDAPTWNSTSPLSYTSSPKLADGSKYQLTVLPGAFEDVMGHTNDTLDVKFVTLTAEDVGMMVLQSDSLSGFADGVLEVRDKSNILIWKGSTTGLKEWKIKNLKPNEYSVRFYRDKNNNGRWDPLDFKKQEEAEYVRLHTSKVQIRANWELKVVLELTI